MNKGVHPIRIHSTGGRYIWDADQETPNFQTASFEYADGALIDFELSNLYAPPAEAWNIFYTSEGYLTTAGKWSAVRGVFAPRSGDVSPSGVSERATNASFPKASYAPGPPIEDQQTVSHFENFIACLRSRKVEDLYCDILEGHMSATLCHLGNISYRTGRKLVFEPATEKIVGDAEASQYLTRTYRAPYVVPDKV
jgi:hypothetical protein